ncbi:MAG: YkgJ family cysteine cluster protein [Nanoarchaeota archaeon]|nr:YkgJ family cysteine cluster protein [Nanoarchaeota archaeon]
MLKIRSPKQEKIVEAVQSFLRGQKELDLPRIGGNKWDFHVYDISVAVDTAYHEIDAAVELIKAEAIISCQKGCGHCCYQPVTATFPEVMLIVEYMKTDKGAKELFVEQYRNWRKNFDPYAYTDAANHDLQAAIRGKESNRLLDLAIDRVQCPMLYDNECTIYQARPMVCRAMLSVDDPEKCKTGGLAMLATGKTLTRVTHMSTSLYIDLSASLGIDGLVNMPMPLAVFEFMNGGKGYVESTAAKVRQMLR